MSRYFAVSKTAGSGSTQLTTSSSLTCVDWSWWILLVVLLLILVALPAALHWLRHGPGDPDHTIRRILLTLVAFVGSGLVFIGLVVEPLRLGNALVQLGAAVTAGVTVGIVLSVIK